MDERRFNVVFKGEIHEQATLSLVMERLALMFKVDVEKIKIMFSKKRTIVKKNAPYDICQKVEQGFLNCGAYVDIEEILPEGYIPAPVEPVPPPGYTPAPDQGTDYPQGQESGYAPEQGHIPGPEEELKPGQEFTDEPGYELPPEQDVMAPGPPPEYTMPPAPEPGNSVPDVSPEAVLQQPLSMEEEPGSAPDGTPDNKQVRTEPNSEKASLPESDKHETGKDKTENDETEIMSVPIPDPEPDFEIVEKSLDNELDGEFEIKGLEPEIEPEVVFGSESDSEYEFDSMGGALDGLELENDNFTGNKRSSNPYAPPLAVLEEDDLTEKSNFVSPQRLPIKNGFYWLTSAFKLFKRNPFTWIISVFIFIFINTITNVIPVIGAAVTSLFSPAFMAGFMIGAKDQHEGKRFRIGHLFAGFSSNFSQLFLFGLLYFIVSMAIFGVMIISFLFIMVISGAGLSDLNISANMAAFVNMSPMIMVLVILVIMLITIPLTMTYYFGPALIAINMASVFNAVKMSFRACLINMLPFLLYSVACLGVLTASILIIGGISALVAMVSKIAGVIVGGICMLLVVFAVTPVFFASIYVAYKDIFYIK